MKPCPTGHVHEMASRDSRREQNQKRFREANARLHDAVEAQVVGAQPVRFLCECADDECLGTVEVTLEEWETVVGKPNHYLMERGHQRSEQEEIVGSLREYDIARKPASP
jgi:hypothetical protein